MAYDTIDFDRDLPTTREDVEALRQAKAASRGEPIDYLAFLALFGDAPPDALRARSGPCGDEPFELP